MKVTDLIIGSLVMANNEQVRVVSIVPDIIGCVNKSGIVRSYRMENLSPIDLTIDLLRKNFKEEKDNLYCAEKEWEDGLHPIYRINNDYIIRVEEGCGDFHFYIQNEAISHDEYIIDLNDGIKYVHELQMWLNVMKIEKELTI